MNYLLSEEEFTAESHCGYCDDCPIEHLCPYDHKEWSK